MTLDLQQIITSKRRPRRELAARPIGEKLAMLDALRERAVLIGETRRTSTVHEALAEYGVSPMSHAAVTGRERPGTARELR